METSSLIGAPIDRTDGRLKVTGGARYAAEINLPGLLHGVIVTSTVASGTIASIDTSKAERSAGVVKVFTHLNAPKLPPEPSGQGAPRPADRKISVLQNPVVFYHLQPVGLVVADTLEHATHAASLVEVKYDEQAPLAGLVSHLQDAYAPKSVGGQKAPTDTAEHDADDALAKAAVKVEQIYQTPDENHNAMEPHATIASWNGDFLTVYDATQGVHTAKQRLADLFKVPPQNVRVICHYVGGGFGSKGPVWSHTALAALIAREIGRPLKINLQRRQVFNNTGHRPHTYQTVKFGADADGKLVGMRHDSVSHTSQFDEFTEPAAQTTRLLYACPNIATSHRLVKLNLGTPSYMRAPGEASGTFALESAMDELAYTLKLDPIELRLRNYAEQDQDEKKPFSSKSLRECYRQAAERFGWERRRANPEPRSVREGRWLVGYGMATATYPVRRSESSCKARLQADGTALVQAGSQDLGTGTWTVMAQIAAQTLGLPMERVRFELGDSALPKTPVSGGSQTAASTGSAVQAACAAVREKLMAMATADEGSPLHGVAAADMAAENGRLFVRSDPSKGETFAALLTRTRVPAVEVEAGSKPGEEKKQFSMHSFGAQFAEVRVDPSSGEVRVARWVGAFGVGNRLNAKTARSQLLGGIVFGIGMALLEKTIADDRDARLVNPNLAEYHVPVNADVPDLDVIFVDEHDEHVNPLGVKGIGEIGVTGAPAAIANAVYHATGIRVRELPITPDKLLGV